MTIQCRTGCGEQITYQQYSFPDGFVYFLPLNLDETVHDCCNVPHNSELHDSYELSHDEKIPDNYRLVEFEVGITNWDYSLDYNEWDVSTLEKLSEEYKKNQLCTLQIMCVLFPSPFKSMYGYNSETKEHYSDLNRLSNYYESLGEYKCAICAREIQDAITHDQSKKILELHNKEINSIIEKQDAITHEQSKKILELHNKEILTLDITGLELRNKYYRKVENTIKSFIRKKYSNLKDFQKDFPDLFSDADKLRANPSKYIKHEHDDVIEFLSFGACVKILKEIMNKKENRTILDRDIINASYFIVNRRNDMEHYSDDTFEESISKETKALGYVYSKQIIEFFEKIDHV